METIEVRIGRLNLRLSPLNRSEYAAAVETSRQLKEWLYEPFSAEWNKAIGDATGFIFIAARRNHPGLSLAELDDEAESEEVAIAYLALTQASREILLRDSFSGENNGSR
jgi:hypothetical protein